MKKFLVLGAIALIFTIVSCSNDNSEIEKQAVTSAESLAAKESGIVTPRNQAEAEYYAYQEVFYREDNNGKQLYSNVIFDYAEVDYSKPNPIYGAYLSVGAHCFYFTWQYGPTGQSGIPSNTPGHSGTISYTVIYLGYGSADSCKP